jgi:hypothetical protein
VSEAYEAGGVRVSGHLPASIASELQAAGRNGRRRPGASH